MAPAALALHVGESGGLSATATDARGNALAGRSVSWLSRSSAVAEVSSNGTVTAVGVGSTAVLATCEGKTDSALVSVTVVPVASVALDSARVFLASLGETRQLHANARDSAGNALSGRTVTWASSNPGSVSVSPTGVVTAAAGGSATVTATVEGKSAAAVVAVSWSAMGFGFARAMAGASLSASVQSIDPATGAVAIAGYDSRRPTIPFTFDWGDGTGSSGFFPQSHTYGDVSRNYVAHVTAHYSANETDYFDVSVRFVAPVITRTAFPAAVTVSLPAQLPALGNCSLGASVTGFGDSYFGATLRRADVEYLLSQAAAIDYAMVEGDVQRYNGEFRQVVLRDPSFGGGYSLWFCTPAALALSDAYLQGSPGYSSIFHEMGHNFTLNAPAAYRFGGRVDGAANAIYSEAIAGMFQIAVAYELITNAAHYGLPQDLTLEIAQSAIQGVQLLPPAYDDYIARGKPFSSWNDPTTSADETMRTFQMLTRAFVLHAEAAHSYIAPLTRAMRLLRTFNPALAAQYAPQTNSPTADAFRATFMVTALSYGFQQDLRPEFRTLNFPIDDALYQSLYSSVP